VDNDKKQWKARVLLTVRTTGDDGRMVTLTPGEYTLSESEGARYQLVRRAETPVCLSLWFAEVLLCAHMGHLEILGVWP
jgi:hypothetical protein